MAIIKANNTQKGKSSQKSKKPRKIDEVKSQGGSKRGLTMKQEKFCREYLLCMNTSEAYRRAYDCSKMKAKSVNNLAYRLADKVEIRSRIDELKGQTEEVVGISKEKVAGYLLEVVGRSLQKQPVMKWDPIAKEEVQVIDSETGEGVWQYDSAGVNRALAELNKMFPGYLAPTRTAQTDSQGQDVPPQLTVVVQPTKTDDKQ